MYINPDYYLYQKIKDQQEKIIRINDELAEAIHTIHKQNQTIQKLKESKQCH